MTRQRFIDEAFRVAYDLGKKVWGYDSLTGRGGVAVARSQVKPEWDRLCLEGDAEWTVVPRGAGEKKGSRPRPPRSAG